MIASVFVGTSLDGFIARPDGALDFLDAGGDEPHGYEEFMATVDAMIIGRKTFETVLGFDNWPYAGKRVIVLSSRPVDFTPIARRGTAEWMSGEPSAIVERLRADGVVHAYVDGGLTIQRFLAAGAIQRLIVTRLPVLIGSGIPLFGPLGRDIELRHVTTRTFASGLVQSEYEVCNPTALT